MRKILTAILLTACSGRPDVTIENIEVKSPRIPVTIHPVIVLPAACDAGAEEISDGGDSG